MKVQFDNSMAEIAGGFGPEYEAAVRKMVVSGVRYCTKRPHFKPRIFGYSNIQGFSKGSNLDGKRLQNHLEKAVDGGTGNMTQQASRHTLMILNMGWDAYVEKSRAVAVEQRERQAQRSVQDQWYKAASFLRGLEQWRFDKKHADVIAKYSAIDPFEALPSVECALIITKSPYEDSRFGTKTYSALDDFDYDVKSVVGTYPTLNVVFGASTYDFLYVEATSSGSKKSWGTAQTTHLRRLDVDAARDCLIVDTGAGDTTDEAAGRIIGEWFNHWIKVAGTSKKPVKFVGCTFNGVPMYLTYSECAELNSRERMKAALLARYSAGMDSTRHKWNSKKKSKLVTYRGRTVRIF